MVEKGTSWREKKLALLEWMVQINDERLIEVLHSIKEAQLPDDDFAAASRNLVERAKTSSMQIEKGDTVALEAIKKEFLG